MTPERWRQITDLYHAALDRDANERAAFLERACADDHALRNEVESLLGHDVPGGGLSSPPVAAMPSPSPGHLAGRRLGVYDLRAFLAAGGMGEVYSAYDPRLEREVAIKVLPPEFAEDREHLQRFEREARAAAALNHPGILAVYDVGSDAGTAFIVMERVPGETLAAHLERERFPIGRTLEISAAIADALAAAHGRGIVHRDLKPGNVMILPDGRVKVLDFGLAKSLTFETAVTTSTDRVAETPLTRVGQIVGTPEYMSPEQLLGRAADRRSDIYSLGVVLFELATGRRPFEGNDFLTIGLNVLTQPAPSPCDLEPSLPAGVGALISSMIAREPSARPQSVAAVKGEIDRLRGQLDVPIAEVIPTPSRSTATSARTLKRLGLAVGILSAVLVLALGGARYWPPGRSAPPAERPIIAVLPLMNLSGDASKDYLGVGISDSLTNGLAKLASISVLWRDPGTLVAQNDLTRVARDLGANLIVQGTLQQSNDRLRVNAKLLKADGTVVWSGDVESSLNDVLAVERRLAAALVNALKIAITPQEQRVLEEPPTTVQAALDKYWSGMAGLESGAGSLDGSITSFEEAIKLDPRFALAHAALGEAYRRKFTATSDQNWMAKSRDAIVRAVEIDRSPVQVRLALVDLYRFTGRNGEAIEELQDVLSEHPSSDEAHVRLAQVLVSTDRTDDAVEEFRQAINLRPRYWRYYSELGRALLLAGRPSDAIPALTRVGELRPEDYETFLRLGTAYQTIGDKVRAKENYERSIQIQPNAGAYSNLGTLHYSEGRFPEAALAYQEAIRLVPNRALNHRNLGDTYLKLRRPVDARTEYETATELTEKALSVNPRDPRLLAQLAVYEAKSGRRRDAERHIAEALSITTVNPDVLYRRAVVFALNGDPNAALGALKEALARGASVELTREDDDFSSLRDLAGYQSLVMPH